MKKPSRKTLRTKLDKICSQIVRSVGHCMWCGEKNNLQCCHIYSRANLQTRWDLMNLVCLCAGCHFRGHQKPIEFASFIQKYLGEENFNELIKRSNGTRVWANYELEELYNKLKELGK